MPRRSIAARLRRRFRRSASAAAPAPPPVPVSSAPAAALRGLGEPPSRPAESADEAELDTLRGELVRELDRMAEGDDGSGSFRRIAS